MYSSNQYDYQKSSASPAPPTPPPFSQQAPASGIPVSPMNQYYPGNSQPPLQVQPRIEVPWSSGLCDCGSDVSNCCITCWCPCITFGQISEIVDRGSSSCVANGVIYALLAYLTGCACFYSGCYRSKMRQQYMLKESPCGACLVHCCCEPCALCQEYRELRNRGIDMSIGWHGNVERQNGGVAMAPVVQGGMNR